MIATIKVSNFQSLQKFPGGLRISRFFCKKIALLVSKELAINYHKTVLSSACVLNELDQINEHLSYEELYNKFFSCVDGIELANMINDFLQTINDESDKESLTLIKLYIFVFFTEIWCQLVEYAKAGNDEKLYFIGGGKSPEYEVLNKTLEVHFPDFYNSITNVNFFSGFQSVLGFLNDNIKKRRELDFSKFSNNFSVNSLPKLKFLNSDKVIVIGVLEERRLSRISELYREISSLGYKVVLFSCLHKSELKKGLQKYPELQKTILYDYCFLDKQEVVKIASNKKSKIKNIFTTLRGTSSVNKDCAYHGVPLFKYTWDYLFTVVAHRYVESAIDQVVIKRFLDETNICCFIGMDNSVATAIWMDECRKRKIPTVFHFYNAILSPIVYHTLLESVHPTAWLLGGESQLKHFSSIDSVRNNRFYVTGDIFADTVVNCDNQSIRKNIRKIAGLSEEDKVVVLVSSYIVSEFSSKFKRILFQSVINSCKLLNYKVIIKGHPNEEISQLRKEMAEWDLDAFVFHHENIRDVFISADLVCMYFSEAAQQAMLVEVPVISLVPSEIVDSFDKHWNYYSSGAVEFVPLGEDPSNAISRVISDSSYRAQLLKRAKDYCEKLLGKCDGKNAKRFAEIVDSLVKESLINNTCDKNQS